METSQAVTKAAMVTTMTTTAHVLAVDDDPSVRQMIADYLTRQRRASHHARERT